MANNVGLVPGVLAGATWTDAGFGASDASFNSLATGSFVLAGTALSPSQSDTDLLMDISFSITGTTGSSGTPYFSLFILPLNQDGTTYGDGTPTGAVPPNSQYWVQNAGVLLSQSGVPLVGMFQGLEIPWGNFKVGIAQFTGNALAAAAAATIKFRTYTPNTNL